ncbi:TetR family transcriptional regulator [Nocardioides sp. R-C-SC26]|uniref:TetR family transcriptional regulator n=1 Tax=Nocardioides sp. R-C-SC26 TaxID=2870414 RepID=UPI001E60E29F|nr:TetR family transcriptional regulator [Nocardioides sp. R-C-SC26]
MTAPAAEPGRRANRRGAATRTAFLEAARQALASGDPHAVSANHIAKLAGATWGAVKYQFGDVDGLWAAVLDYLAERRGEIVLTSDDGAALADRVHDVVANLWRGLDTTDARAMDTLRSTLPREQTEREAQFPKTTAALEGWNAGWAATCEAAFGDLDVPVERVRAVAAFIPGAVRGLVSEEQLGTYTDLALARAGLGEAIIAYFSAP